MVIQIQVPDRCVTYEELLDDLALRLAPLLRTDNREVISQREAYRIFGEGNVRRWFSKDYLISLTIETNLLITLSLC